MTALHGGNAYKIYNIMEKEHYGKTSGQYMKTSSRRISFGKNETSNWAMALNIHLQISYKLVEGQERLCYGVVVTRP